MYNFHIYVYVCVYENETQGLESTENNLNNNLNS